MPTTAALSSARRALGLATLPLVWLERARGRRRLALLALYALAAVVGGAWLWRAASLLGLPDVGDPFDVAAFRARIAVPDAENAYVLHRLAYARCKPIGAGHRTEVENVFAKGWVAASPATRDWLAANGETLDLWRRGTERPQALNLPPEDEIHARPPADLRMLADLGMLEAERRLAGGDVAGAWDWHLAVLRSSRHAEMHASLSDSVFGSVLILRAMPGLARWAAHPNVDAARLGRAVRDTMALDGPPMPASEAVKREYLQVMRQLDRARSEMLRPPPDSSRWHEHLPAYRAAMAFLRREPERSRRVLRLVFANWLAYADRPPSSQPPWVGPGLFDASADPAAPASARALSPDRLGEWLDSTLYAKEVWRRNSYGIPGRGRALRAALVVELARRWYALERGAPPASDRDLVGRYLPSLPDDDSELAPPAEDETSP